jgi:hypothetical protein
MRWSRCSPRPLRPCTCPCTRRAGTSECSEGRSVNVRESGRHGRVASPATPDTGTARRIALGSCPSLIPGRPT